MSKSKSGKFSTADKYGTISTTGSNKGEFVPFDPKSYPRPSNFVCDDLKMLFGCSVDGLSCTLTISGKVDNVPLGIPYNDEDALSWDLYNPDIFETKTASVYLIKYQAGDWSPADVSGHYQSRDSSRTIGKSRASISISWTESYFLRWQTSPGSVTVVNPEDTSQRANLYLSGEAVTLYYDLYVPDIPFENSGAFYGFPASTDVAIPDQYSGTPWTLDGNFYGFPYIKNIGIAPKFDGFIWTMDGQFFGFPYIKKSGIAPEYDGSVWTIDDNFWGFPYIRFVGIAPQYQKQQGGFSNLYLGADNVPKLYLGRRLVNRAYRGKVLVFEKG